MNGGAAAEDMACGDYSEQRIRQISQDFLADQIETVSAGELFTRFREMASYVSIGELEDNINRMIDHFEESTGAEYMNEALSATVRQHESTEQFVNAVRAELDRLILKYEGDVGRMKTNEVQPDAVRPQFSGLSDMLGGLKIAINDSWAWDVDLTQYDLSPSGNYSGAFLLTLYDHFGLDRKDVEEFGGVPGWVRHMLSMAPLPIELAAEHVAETMARGFRAWFILQHLERMQFRPFITKIALEYDFSGKLHG